MAGINVGRWVAGGVAAGVVVWLLEGAASVLYMNDMQAALQRLGLSFEMSAAMWVLSVVVSLITGFALVFFYAAARPRFGPGPKTAVIVAVALWLSGYLLSLIGYYMIHIYPTGMLAQWGVAGLVEMIIAALVGGWVYREGAAA
jgi:hypothetical protein